MYISTNGKDVIWSYDEEEFANQAFKGKYEHRYIKGLGSLDEHEYERVVREPIFDVVEVDEHSKGYFEMLFGDDPKKRKEWIYG